MLKTRNSILALIVIASWTAISGCEALQEGMEGHLDTVAQADGYRLTVDHAAALIAQGNPQIVPTTNRIADPVAEAWVNYTLLTAQLAGPEGLSAVDYEFVGRRDHDQRLVWKLYEDAVLGQLGPAPTDGPATPTAGGAETEHEVRHIVFRVGDDMTEAEVDSIRRFAESLRQRIVDGADFSDLALRYSQDPGSAPAGGSLGWRRPGEVLSELEQVFISLEIGEVSPITRSPTGLHILQVTRRRARPDDSEGLEAAMERERRLRNIEDAYIDSMLAAANPRYAHEYANRLRRLAADPRIERMSAVERSQPLVTFRGGKVTVGEVVDWIIVGAPNSRSTITGADDPGLENLLREMIRSKLLIKSAIDSGYTLSPAEADSVASAAERLVAAAAVSSGIRADDLTGEDAVAAAVDMVMIQVLNGERSTKGVDRVSRAIRSGQTYQFYPDRFPRVGEELARLRGEGR